MLSKRKIGPWLLAAGLSLSHALLAGPLPKPETISVDAGDGALISWAAVEGADVYRVAVFDAAEADGKRPLLAAVWVKGLAWDYAKGPVLAKAGRMPSTKPLPLPRGRSLRVMVAAAKADGADKSEWAGEDFLLPLAQAQGTPTATPTPTPSPEPEIEVAADGEAELELEGADEFKRSPEPAVLDVDEAPTTVGVAAAGATAGLSSGAVALSAETASGLLKAGKADEAEAMYRALLKKDATDAGLWEGLGDALLKKRMKAEAHEAYSQALLLDDSRKHLREWIKQNVTRR